MDDDNIKPVLAEARAGMEKSLDSLRRELSRLRTGRASVDLLDSVRVDYYGVPTPVHQMATVSAPEPRLLTIKPWERGQAKAIEKAIRDSDLGLNPQSDGELIRLPIPALTEERRREMVRQVHRATEDCRVAIRKHRRDGNDMFKEMLQESLISEDNEHDALNEVQKITTEYIGKADAIAKQKEQELLTV